MLLEIKNVKMLCNYTKSRNEINDISTTKYTINSHTMKEKQRKVIDKFSIFLNIIPLPKKVLPHHRGGQ